MELLHCLQVLEVGHQSCDNATQHPRQTGSMSCAVRLAISVKVDIFSYKELQPYARYLSSCVWVLQLRNEEGGSVFMYILFVTSTLDFTVFSNCAYCWLRKVVKCFRWMRCTGKRQSSTACLITLSSLAS